MSIAKDSVSMGKFPLNARVPDLNGFYGKLEKRFGDLGYKTEVTQKDGSLQLLMSKDGLFKTVPGLFPFI